jgi:hypothetical protein
MAITQGALFNSKVSNPILMQKVQFREKLIISAVKKILKSCKSEDFDLTLSGHTYVIMIMAFTISQIFCHHLNVKP